jgi:hypothetical protein
MSGFSLNYVCEQCGTIRRAEADRVPGGRPTPICCGKPMRELSDRQTAASTKLTQAQRVKWLAAGGRCRKIGGHRKWKAVFGDSD